MWHLLRLHFYSFPLFGRCLGVILCFCTAFHCLFPWFKHDEVTARRGRQLPQICVSCRKYAPLGQNRRCTNAQSTPNFSQEGWLTLPEDTPRVKGFLKGCFNLCFCSHCNFKLQIVSACCKCYLADLCQGSGIPIGSCIMHNPIQELRYECKSNDRCSCLHGLFSHGGQLETSHYMVAKHLSTKSYNPFLLSWNLYLNSLLQPYAEQIMSTWYKYLSSLLYERR